MRFFHKENPLRIKIPHGPWVSRILFFLSFWLFTGAALYADTTLRYDHKDIYRLLVKISWWCVLLAVANLIFLSDYTIRQLLLFILISFLLYISYKNSGYRWFLQSFIILLSAKHVRWRQLVTDSTVYYALLLLSIFLCYCVGLTHGMGFTRGDRIRVDIGFIQPNLFGAYIMVLAMLWVSARYERLKFWDYGIVAAAAAAAWFLPHSRTSSMILVLLLIALFVMKKWGDRLLSLPAIRILFLLVYPACFFVSLISSYLYAENKTLLVLVNKLLTGRIALAHSFIEFYPVTLMGQKIKLVSSSKSILTGQPSAILDNAYMRLYIHIGVITTVIALAMLVSVVYYALKKNNQALLINLTLFALYGLAEFRITKITANVFLIAFAFLFQKEDTPPAVKREGT